MPRYTGGASRNTDAAHLLLERLRHGGFESVFLDADKEQGIPNGSAWEKVLYRRLRACQAVIALVSKESLASDWCKTEVHQARALEKHIFPVRLDDATSDVLGELQYLDLRGDKQEDPRAWDSLLSALERAKVSKGFWNRSRSPYPGLSAFEEADAGIFFGREREVAACIARMNELREKQSPTAPSSNPATRSRVDPLSGHSYRVTFTASARLTEKMDRARELLSHAISPSDLPALLERALDQLIDREEWRRYGGARHDAPKFEIRKSESPRCDASEHASQRRELRAPCELHAPCQNHAETQRELQDPDPNLGTWAEPRSRYEPAAVRRAVWTRDAGQCTFKDSTGRRCEQRHFLELDHREAFAIGGEATVENLRLRCRLCRAHNALEAEKLFGRERIERTIAHAKSKRPECAE